ncbi:MAG: hypothetical protein KDA83_16570, partial [Planctomycetales bacterium]|nr:hypothetical protein [Planctomycetales bacterium]
YKSLDHEYPGFRFPSRLHLQWFELSDAMINPPLESITDAQVQAKYDELVAAKDLKVILPPPRITPSETPVIPPANGGDPAPTGAPTDPDSGEATPENGEGSEAPGVETPTSETPSTESPGTETPEGNAPATTDPSTDEPGTGDGQSNLLPGSNGQQFVSIQEEPTEPALAAPNTTAQEQPTGTPEDEPVAPETETTEPLVVEIPATSDGSQESTDEQPTSEVQIPGDEDPTTPSTDPLIRPLDDELKAEIRTMLQREIANKKREEILETLRSRLAEYMGEYVTYRAEVDSGVIPADSPAPATPDFKAWASEFEIAFGDTEKLYDFEQVNQLPLGQQFVEFDPMMLNMGRMPSTVVQELFSRPVSALTLYEPRGTAFGRHVYWVAEASASHVPSLEECEKDIIRHWRWSKAVELAKADAAKRLEKVGANQTLRDVYPDEAKASLSFSAWSIGGGNLPQSGGMQPTLSPVPIEMPAAEGDEFVAPERLEELGLEFMQAVFAAKPGDKVVATDFRNQRVFAINVIERTTTEPLSETAVMNQTAPSPMANAVIGVDMGMFVRDWMWELQEKRHVRWSVRP